MVPTDPALAVRRGVFVTLLTADGSLRGCMGSIEPAMTLAETVIDQACAAASADPRFEPVGAAELGGLTIKVSVLSEPMKLETGSADELASWLGARRPGVILETPFARKRSVFLPEVWDRFAAPEQFLDQLCHKQDAPVDTWRTAFELIEIRVFETRVYDDV